MALTNTPFSSLKSLHPSHHRLTPSFKPSSLPTTKLHPKSSIKPFSFLKIMKATQPWKVDSWKSKKALQLPVYPNEQELKKVLETLKESPPLVFAGEARTLEQSLAEAAKGNAFLLQGGDCAESFKEFSANKYRDTFRVLLQMAVILMYGAQVPVVKVGRMAGQFAKPRSDSFEERGEVILPSYRGDIINGDAFTEEERIPDPNRLLRAYNQSASTMNLLGAFSRGGYASLERVADWKLDFLKGEQRVRYENLAEKIDDALGFLKAMSRFNVNDPVLNMTEFWTSHECLLLPYEQQLTREDSTMEGNFYDCSAHMVWAGERTRQLDGAHVEFMRGISNPIGIKVSDKMDPNELVELINILNPNNKPGRITIIVRMGAEKLRVKFPSLIRAVGESEQIATWVSDPMHGNTIKAPCGLKTRSFDSIMDEIRAFFEIHEEEGSVPGGIHLEMTGQNVTECVGGTNTVNFDDLNLRYHTHCDPRLNNSQSLELAFLVSGLLKRRRINRP